MQRKTRAEMKAETRERLLNSTREMFGRKGFGATTIDDIAENAGFSRGAFYSHFASKEDIAIELTTRHLAEHDGGPEPAGVEADGDRLSDRDLLRLEMLMLAQRDPAFAARCRALYRPHVEKAAETAEIGFIRGGRSSPADPVILAHAVMSLRLGAALLHRAAGPIPLGEILDVLSRAFSAVAPEIQEAA